MKFLFLSAFILDTVQSALHMLIHINLTTAKKKNETWDIYVICLRLYLLIHRAGMLMNSFRTQNPCC